MKTDPEPFQRSAASNSGYPARTMKMNIEFNG